jgi:hypothetical protein
MFCGGLPRDGLPIMVSSNNEASVEVVFGGEVATAPKGELQFLVELLDCQHP